MDEQPTKAEKALIVATLTAGIMCAPDSLTIYNESNPNELTFREWAIEQATPMAKSIFERLT